MTNKYWRNIRFKLKEVKIYLLQTQQHYNENFISYKLVIVILYVKYLHNICYFFTLIK